MKVSGLRVKSSRSDPLGLVFQISHLKKDLLVCSEERDSAQLERDLFSNRLKHLDSELESEKITHTDRSREIRCLEVRLSGSKVTNWGDIKLDGSKIGRRRRVGKWRLKKSVELGVDGVCACVHRIR